MNAADRTSSDQYCDSLLLNLRMRMAEEGFSERSLSLAIGRNPGWLSGLLARSAVPSAVDLYKISTVLNCSVDWFFRSKHDTQSRQINVIVADRVRRSLHSKGYNRPELPDVLRWFFQEDGVLVNDDHIKDFYNLYAQPTKGQEMPQPTYLGKHSLAAVTLHIDTASELRTVYESLDAGMRREINSDHRQVCDDRKPALSPKSILLEADQKLSIHLDYMRLLLPVRTSSGQLAVLNYSHPVETKEVINAAGSGPGPADGSMVISFPAR